MEENNRTKTRIGFELIIFGHHLFSKNKLSLWQKPRLMKSDDNTKNQNSFFLFFSPYFCFQQLVMSEKETKCNRRTQTRWKIFQTIVVKMTMSSLVDRKADFSIGFEHSDLMCPTCAAGVLFLCKSKWINSIKLIGRQFICPIWHTHRPTLTKDTPAQKSYTRRPNKRSSKHQQYLEQCSHRFWLISWMN